jgi:hypothetical protein
MDRLDSVDAQKFPSTSIYLSGFFMGRQVAPLRKGDILRTRDRVGQPQAVSGATIHVIASSNDQRGAKADMKPSPPVWRSWA